MFSDTREDMSKTLTAMYEDVVYRCRYITGGFDKEMLKVIGNDRRFDHVDAKALLKDLQWNNGRLSLGFDLNKDKANGSG
jgi:hypothetical protein